MNTVAPRTSPTAVVSLVFGIACWCAIPFIGAIIAIVTGHIARSEIRQAAPGSIEGDGLALAGLILGYLHLVLFVLAAIVFFMFLGGMAVLGGWMH